MSANDFCFPCSRFSVEIKSEFLRKTSFVHFWTRKKCRIFENDPAINYGFERSSIHECSIETRSCIYLSRNPKTTSAANQARIEMCVDMPNGIGFINKAIREHKKKYVC